MLILEKLADAALINTTNAALQTWVELTLTRSVDSVEHLSSCDWWKQVYTEKEKKYRVQWDLKTLAWQPPVDTEVPELVAAERDN